jgi:hypothetical protein
VRIRGGNSQKLWDFIFTQRLHQVAKFCICLLWRSPHPPRGKVAHWLSDSAFFGSMLLFFFYYWWGGTKSLGTAATSGLLYKPQMIGEDDCGAIGGIKIGRGNRSTRRKSAPAPIVHHKSHMTRPGLEPRTAAVGSQRLTAWSMARLEVCWKLLFHKNIQYLWRTLDYSEYKYYDLFFGIILEFSWLGLKNPWNPNQILPVENRTLDISNLKDGCCLLHCNVWESVKFNTVGVLFTELRIASALYEALDNYMTLTGTHLLPLARAAHLRAQRKLGKGLIRRGSTMSWSRWPRDLHVSNPSLSIPTACRSYNLQ